MDKPSTQAALVGAGVLLGIGATLATQTLLSPPTGRRGSSSHTVSFLHTNAPPREDIRSGLEECIGNTPLIRLSSLSAATGCEILGKAEVCRCTLQLDPPPAD